MSGMRRFLSAVWIASCIAKARAALLAFAMAALLLAQFAMAAAPAVAAPAPPSPDAALTDCGHHVSPPTDRRDDARPGAAHVCVVACCVVAPAPLAPVARRGMARFESAAVVAPPVWASLTRAPPSPPPRG